MRSFPADRPDVAVLWLSNLKVRFRSNVSADGAAGSREHGHAHDHADQKTQRYQDGKRSLEMQEEKGDGDRPVLTETERRWPTR